MYTNLEADPEPGYIAVPVPLRQAVAVPTVRFHFPFHNTAYGKRKRKWSPTIERQARGRNGMSLDLSSTKTF
jgi:hypothetical protein